MTTFLLRNSILATLVGAAFTLSGAVHAGTWTQLDLGTLGGASSWVYGISRVGQVSGESLVAGNSAYQGFVYGNGVMQGLGTLGGTASAASGVNAAGQAVGASFTTGNAAIHGFLYSNGAMQDLGTLGGGFSWASHVNGVGQVAGYSSTPGNAAFHAFIYGNGVWAPSVVARARLRASTTRGRLPVRPMRRAIFTAPSCTKTA